MRAHRYSSGFRGQASPLTWLFTLADHCFFDTLRKRLPVSGEELREFLNAEQAGFEAEFLAHDLVVRLLSRCPDDTRAIVVHRYFDELDLDAIAQRLDLNERTVRRKLEQFLVLARKLAQVDR